MFECIFDYSKIKQSFIILNLTLCCQHFRTEVIEMASEYASSLGYRDRDHPLSAQWYRNFMSRWPGLKVVKPRGLQIQRAKATSAESVDRYFTELEAILKKYGLLTCPERIYNVDEKGISTMHKPPSVVAATGTKPPSVTSGGRVNITVIGCGNALGHQIPPYFIFPGQRMNQDLLEGKTPGADGTVSESGWSNSEVFMKYLSQHLLKYLPQRTQDHPVLLMYDGHKSHVSLDVIDWAKENHVVLFVLPAHTSHVLQPMDIGCFGPFERIYNAAAHKFMRTNCGISITRNNICEVACKAYVAALSPQNLQGSFRKAGIYPFNPDIVDESNFLPSTVLQQETNNNNSPQTPSTRLNIKEPELEFFVTKESPIRKKKQATKKRRNISNIISGKAISEDEVLHKIVDYQSTNPKKRRTTGTPTTAPSTATSKAKTSTTITQEPGPSHYYVDDSDESDTSSIPEEDKCCVCHQFTPQEVRQSVSLIFTKWAQCDLCEHWVHLIYCTETRVVRRGDSFLCPHCKEE